MIIFTPKQVVAKITEFNELMMKERALQEELLSLNISGSKDQVKMRAKRHDLLITEIEKLRLEGMMPILEELSKFIAYCQKVEKGEINLGDPFPGLNEEIIMGKDEDDGQPGQEQNPQEAGNPQSA